MGVDNSASADAFLSSGGAVWSGFWSSMCESGLVSGYTEACASERHQCSVSNKWLHYQGITDATALNHQPRGSYSYQTPPDNQNPHEPKIRHPVLRRQLPALRKGKSAPCVGCSAGN